MNDKEVILSIDDNPSNQKLIEAMLKADYDVHLASSGEEGLRQLEGLKPEVVLLDVDMPKMDGYEVCEKIREIHTMDEMPVMFVSALDKIPQRLRGYEVGGNDYMVKPIDIAEVRHKIRRLIDNKNQTETLQSSVQYSTQTAMSAMTYSGELGVLIEFFENAITSYDYETLAKHTLSACAKYDLSSSLQVRTGADLLEWSSGSVSPLESQLLEYGAQANRIVTHKDFMFFNAADVTLLLKKLPLDDADKVERIRDHVAIILKGLEAQLKIIHSRQERKMLRADAIETASKTGVRLIVEMMDESSKFSQRIEDGYEDLRVRIIETSALNELDEDQEKAILDHLEVYANEMRNSLQFLDLLENSMEDLTQQLREIANME